MPPILIIVESPNKTKKIEEMFPGKFKVMASYGHVCDLPHNPQNGIGINRETLEGEYELTENSRRFVDGKRTISKIKQYLKDHPGTEVYLGTDEDREGESIAAFITHYLNLKNPKRMRFNAITKEKIQQAFDSAGEIDWGAVSSREARRLIDRIIGYTVSPVLLNIVREKGVAAGRVQTAVEALVIERERKIRNHKKQTYYTVQCDMGGWLAKWQVPAAKAKRANEKTNSDYDLDETGTHCTDEQNAKEVASLKTLIVSSCEETTTYQLPPSPLYTISMIQLANKVFDWDAGRTMETAQKLFEGDGSGHGHITYHRTDSPNIDPIAAQEIRQWLHDQGLPIPATPNKWVCKNKQAQEGHEAIRPTYFTTEDAGTTDDQRALYKLIRDRAIYSQLSPATYAVKKIVLKDSGQGTHIFTASTRTQKDPGWLNTKLAQNPIMQETDENPDQIPEATVKLPNLQPGIMANIKNAEIVTHTTKAPPRYTMNTLTSKLERLSIGRPATIASLLKNVQTKGTVKLGRDKKLTATPLAEKCYDILYPRFLFANIGYTAELEQALDQIATGQLDGQALSRSVWDRLDEDCHAIRSQPL
jgi:DNA topoisomerase-1